MKTLSIFDIDHTIFNTKAQVLLERDGHIVHEFYKNEYTNYPLMSGEKFDYSQFRSARFFYDTSTPIQSVIDRLLFEMKSSEIIFLTARPDLDNRELFLEKFRLHGIPIDKIHIHRAGNVGGMKSYEAKLLVLKEKYLGNYSHYKMFDDHLPNLDAFLSLKHEYKEAIFHAYHVNPKGQLTFHF